jgi:esterase/lipase superfamily enzyme
MINRTRNARITIIAFFALLLSGCGSLRPYTLNLAPPPDYYAINKINPLEDVEPLKDNTVSVFYATNRKSSDKLKPKSLFYSNERNRQLNVGKAMVRFGNEETTWDELKKYAVQDKGRKTHRLQVMDIEEFGQLNYARLLFDPDRDKPEFSGPDERFAREINEQLAKSKRKVISIFVHGFKVPFEDPALTCAQLGYYTGFDGVALAFSWPSSQKTFAYLADVEQTQYAARYLSFLLKFLAESTDVERINVFAHSAGSRVLARALTDISLLSGTGSDREENIKRFKLGDIVFAGGDLSKDVMGVYFEYGILDVSSRTIVYFSSQDKALRLSHWLWKQGRIGDFQFNLEESSPARIAFLQAHPNLELVDASGIPGSTLNYGHVYFLDSPWVSSDLLLAMTLGLTPQERGLIRDESGLVWEFPKDYKTEALTKKFIRKLNRF